APAGLPAGHREARPPRCPLAPRPLARSPLALARLAAPGRYDIPAEPRHLRMLRGELEQHQADPGLLVGAEPGGDLLWRADQAAAQAPVGDAVLLHGDPGL